MARATMPSTTTATILPVSELLTEPSHTQMAFITPVCVSPGGRAMYMNRQMIPAPTKEMAIGRKISDLAMFSPFDRSASTATPSPRAVDSVVTTMTHQMLLKIVPRTVDSTAQASRKKPIQIGIIDASPRSNFWRVLRPDTMPAMTPTATMPRAT